MKKFIIIACVFLTGCSIAHDGEYVQVAGKPIDHQVIEKLQNSKATLDEVKATLGTPKELVKIDNKSEILRFESIRQRTSFETLFEIKHSESTQIVIDDAELIFEDGRLEFARLTTEQR